MKTAKLKARVLASQADAPNPIAWRPHPDNLPQQRAFASQADVIGFGGSAGGGKTSLELGIATTGNHRKTVIFRRQATQLREIIDQSKEIIGNHGRLNEQVLIWKNLPQGRQIEFAGVKELDDVEKWKGRPHDLLCFDEAPEFSENQVRFLMGWNRTTDPTILCQVLLAFNPPTNSDGEWIITYFGPWLDEKHPHPAEPGEIRWYARVDNQDVERPDNQPFEHTLEGGKVETITPTSRTFFPARLADNPYFKGTKYEAQLQALPEPLRSQLLYGDFQAARGDDAYQVIPRAWVRAAMDRWRLTPKPADMPMTAEGIDVARGGDDQTVRTPVYGRWVDRQIKLPGVATKTGIMVIAPVIKALIEQGEASLSEKEIEYPDEHITMPVLATCNPLIKIDVIGIGSSAYDTARTHRLNAVGVNWAEGTDEKDKSGKLVFQNKRVRDWWRLREMLDPKIPEEEQLFLPDDDELLKDLTAPRWTPLLGKIKMELKQETKERRGGKSPDCGDSLVIALSNAGTSAYQWLKQLEKESIVAVNPQVINPLGLPPAVGQVGGMPNPYGRRGF